MNDYQAIYDATTRALMGAGGKVSAGVQQAFGEAGGQAYAAAQAWMGAGYDVGTAMTRPSVLYRPRIFINGGMWCALYGENVQDGVAGFGNSPEAAMANFDAAWTAKLEAA